MQLTNDFLNIYISLEVDLHVYSICKFDAMFHQ